MVEPVAPAGAAELVAQLYPALAGGNRAALDRLLDPEFEGYTTPGLPLELGGHYRGAAAMRRDFWGGIARAYEAVAEPLEFHALCDGRVVVVGCYAGKARSTGTAFTADFVHIVSTRDGRITRLKQLTDSQRWTAALVDSPIQEGQNQ